MKPPAPVRALACLVLLLPLAPFAAARAPQGSAQDYERVTRLARSWRGALHAFAPELHWTADGGALWFQHDHADGRREFVLVDARDGARRPAFDTAALAAALEPALGRELDPERLPLDWVELSADRASVLVRHGSRHWRFFIASAELVAADDEAPLLEPLPSNSGPRGGGRESSILFQNRLGEAVRLHWEPNRGEQRPYGVLEPGEERAQHTFAGHLWSAETVAEGRAVALFRAGQQAAVARIDAGSEAALAPPPRRRGPREEARFHLREHQVFVRRGDDSVQLTSDGSAADSYEPRFHPSPDGRRLLAFQSEPDEGRELVLVESAPPDALQPRVVRVPYLKPGDRKRSPRPRLFDLERHTAIPVDAAPFADAWSIGDVHWAPDSSRVFLRYDRRGHQLQHVYAIDAASGQVTSVLEERAATFIDYSQKTWLHWLDGAGELLWTSERDGWNHVYRLDLARGELHQVTRGEFVVRAVERIDAAERRLLLRVMGYRSGEDPYHAHLARVDLDTGELTLLTDADGTHEWTFSPDREHFVARWSRVDQPWVSELRRSSDGSLVCELGRDDAGALHAAGFAPPQRFAAPGRDGATAIHGILIRPSNFDPARTYPVIEAIYAGPHGFHVPKTFGLGLRERALAELGFIVAQIDGMGTNWRHKAFHDVAWMNLADAGFPDRIAWLRAAAAAHPELDLERVGIFGGSAGGQNALGALLFHGDFYDAAAADCGCHDNRMDKMWWNEAWMGWPLGPHYEASSNVTHAHRLVGKLLLTVGELDRNVDPASTLQVVDALIRADKDFEFVLVPGGGHGVGETPYLVRRRQDFFVRHLLGVEPRWQ